MPHTTIAFAESIDEAAAWANWTAVVDPHIRTAGDFVYIGEMNKIIGAHVMAGTVPDQVRLQSPSIRRINPYYINHLEAALVQAGDVEDVFHPGAVVPLDVNEGLELEANGNPAAGEQHTGIIFLAATPPAKVDGNIFPVHFTTTVALAANVWTYAEIVLVDDLPVGTYDVVGGRLESATSIAFRFVPVGGNHRPGGVCVPGPAYIEPRFQRFGGLGVWMSFNSVQLPGIEVIDSAATGSTAMDGYFDLIRRG